MMTSDEAQYIY